MGHGLHEPNVAFRFRGARTHQLRHFFPDRAILVGAKIELFE